MRENRRKMRGAEAVVSFEDDRVVKERVEKGYRHPDIDLELRKDRTRDEARLLEKAEQAGVRVPKVVERSDFKLVIELVDGEKLRDVFEEREDLWKRFGEDVGRLHSRNIIHGDLTTSNVLVKEDELYFIDFGLGFSSQRVEDKATDLRLLKQVLDSTHYKVSERAFEIILEGYEKVYEGSGEVVERLNEIKSRTRYS